MRALVVHSERRFRAFVDAFARVGVEAEELHLSDPEWLTKDYKPFDVVVFYPQFRFTSNSPHALWEVKDCFRHLVSRCGPDTVFYPDPNLIDFYNDKYKQFLFLKSSGLPIPDTIALTSSESLDIAIETFGFPSNGMRLARRPVAALVVPPVIAVLLRSALLPLFSVPYPIIRDEFAYLLPADTSSPALSVLLASISSSR